MSSWTRLADKLRNHMIEIRPTNVRAEPRALELLKANGSRSAFDESVLDYPACEVFAARSNGKTHGYLPVQQVAVLESFGANPDSTAQEITESLVELVKVVSALAYRGGQREIL